MPKNSHKKREKKQIENSICSRENPRSRIIWWENKKPELIKRKSERKGGEKEKENMRKEVEET